MKNSYLTHGYDVLSFKMLLKIILTCIKMTITVEIFQQCEWNISINSMSLAGSPLCVLNELLNGYMKFLKMIPFSIKLHSDIICRETSEAQLMTYQNIHIYPHIHTTITIAVHFNVRYIE